MSKRRILLYGIGALIALGVIGNLLGGGNDKPAATPVPTQIAAAQPAATQAPQPTAVPATAATKPAPTAVPPTATPPPPTPTPKPIALSGSGQTVTDEFSLPGGAATIRFTHNGAENFIVKAIPTGGRETLLVNAIGAYQGTRLLAASEPLVLEINADGAWTADVATLAVGGQPPFSGEGDSVSARFDPPANGAWEISHDGAENFIVKLHCASGSSLVQNDIGAVSGSVMARFGRGPCLWEVQADGEWSLKPR